MIVFNHPRLGAIAARSLLGKAGQSVASCAKRIAAHRCLRDRLDLSRREADRDMLGLGGDRSGDSLAQPRDEGELIVSQANITRLVERSRDLPGVLTRLPGALEAISSTMVKRVRLNPS